MPPPGQRPTPPPPPLPPGCVYKAPGVVARELLMEQIARWDAMPKWKRAWMRVCGHYSGRDELADMRRRWPEEMRRRWPEEMR